MLKLMLAVTPNASIFGSEPAGLADYPCGNQGGGSDFGRLPQRMTDGDSQCARLALRLADVTGKRHAGIGQPEDQHDSDQPVGPHSMLRLMHLRAVMQPVQRPPVVASSPASVALKSEFCIATPSGSAPSL